MTNPMANPDPVPERFTEPGPASLADAHQASHDHAPQQSFREVTNEVAEGATITEEDVLEAMRDVIDPELGINVVDLGLVYGVHIDENNAVVMDMTLTSAACPLTDVIQDQAATVLASMVSAVAINWVWMAPWGPDCITEEGREQLRALGFNV